MRILPLRTALAVFVALAFVILVLGCFVVLFFVVIVRPFRLEACSSGQSAGDTPTRARKSGPRQAKRPRIQTILQPPARTQIRQQDPEVATLAPTKVRDVRGAGDTVLAALSVEIVTGKLLREFCRAAMGAAGRQAAVMVGVAGVA